MCCSLEEGAGRPLRARSGPARPAPSQSETWANGPRTTRCPRRAGVQWSGRSLEEGVRAPRR